MTNTLSKREILDRGAAAIKRGDIAKGRQMLQQLLESDPRNVLALLWMTKCTEDPYEKVALFQQVLSLDPANPHALKALDLYRKYVKPTRQPIPQPPSRETSVSAADFDSGPPSSSLRTTKVLNAAIVAVAILLFGVLAILVLSATPASPTTTPTSDPVDLLPVEPKINFDENCPLLEVAAWIEESNDMTDRITVFIKISGTGEKNTFVENVDNMVTVGNLYYEWKDVPRPPCLKELHGLYEEALYHLMFYYSESANGEFLSADEELEKSLASLDEFATMRELFGFEHLGLPKNR